MEEGGRGAGRRSRLRGGGYKDAGGAHGDLYGSVNEGSEGSTTA